MIYRLRSLFGRYWALYLAGVAVIGSVAVTVLVQIFRFTNGPAQWFFNYISKWTVASGAGMPPQRIPLVMLELKPV